MTLSLRSWGTRIALVYACFAAATLGFAVFAMSQRVDLVAPDYYARSLTHDDRLRATARVDALGDAFQLVASRDGRTVRITIPAQAAAGFHGNVTLYRAADSSFDRTYELGLARHGVQELHLADLPPGAWRMQVWWRAGGHEYYTERPVTLR